jgi:hypothetical protein
MTAKRYVPRLIEVVPYFPANPYDPWEWREAANDYDETTETFTVPPADSEGRHRIELSNVIADSTGLVVESNSETLVNIPYGITPSTGEAAVNIGGVPIVEFHESREGEEGTVTYRPLGTARSALRMNRVEQELAALSANVEAAARPVHRSLFLPGLPSQSTSEPGAGQIRLHPQGATTRKLIELSIATVEQWAANDEFLQIAVTTATTAGAFNDGANGKDVTLSVPQTRNAVLNPNGLWTIDLSSGAVWLNVFCLQNPSGYQNLMLELVLA